MKHKIKLITKLLLTLTLCTVISFTTITTTRADDTTQSTETIPVPTIINDVNNPALTVDIITAWNSLPDRAKKVLNDTKCVIYVKNDIGRGPLVYGYAKGKRFKAGEQTIRFETTIDIRANDDIVHVFYHEVGHVVGEADIERNKTEKSYDTVLFQNCIAGEEDAIVSLSPIYKSVKPANEMFAESFALWITTPEFRTKCPKMAAYWDVMMQ